MLPFFDRRLSLYRATDLLVDATTPATSVPISRQPARAAVVEVTLNAAGTVVVSGTLDTGATHSDTLAFTGSDSKDTGGYAYTALNALACSGATATEVKARALGKDGAPQVQFTLLAAGRPGQVRGARSTGWDTERAGAQVQGSEVVLLCWEPTVTPGSGDEVRDDSTGERWVLADPVALEDPYQPLYWRSKARRLG